MYRCLTTLALILVCSWTNSTRAGEYGHGAHCPRCHELCYPTVTKGTEKKSCWEVETKVICIPKVRFPWESKCCNKGCGKDGCVPPKCGRTKCVNVLVKHEYECSTCKYSWDVDSDKYDNGKHDEYKSSADEAAETGPAFPDPPPVEARLPHSNRRVAPAAFEQGQTEAPAKRSFTETVTSFFR